VSIVESGVRMAQERSALSMASASAMVLPDFCRPPISEYQPRRAVGSASIFVMVPRNWLGSTTGAKDHAEGLQRRGRDAESHRLLPGGGHSTG
jgi:hypothetical protein